MALELGDDTLINAPPSVVWGILTNLNEYKAWKNPFIVNVKAPVELREGSQISITVRDAKGTDKHFKPVISMFDDRNYRFEWTGKVGLQSIFEGCHKFHLEETEDGKTRLRHTETFRGWLVSLMKSKLMNDTRPMFKRMNEALKKIAEECAVDARKGIGCGSF